MEYRRADRHLSLGLGYGRNFVGNFLCPGNAKVICEKSEERADYYYIFTAQSTFTDFVRIR